MHKLEKINLPESFLEDLGLIAFYGNWCSVCLTRTPSEEKTDSSLRPVIQALERLKDILYGRNDFISPYFAGPSDEIEATLSDEFGEGAVARLLPDITEIDGEFRLFAWTTNDKSLVSTYLWKELRLHVDIEEAFNRWIMCQRVYGGTAVPVEFDVQELEESKGFNSLMLKQLADDVSLSKSSTVLLRQIINSERFSSLAAPVMMKRQIDISHDDNSRSNHPECEELPKPTLETLERSYPNASLDDLDELQFAATLSKYAHSGHMHFFYSWAVFSCIDASIFVDSQTLSSTGFTEALLDLSKSRPALKYLLFNDFPFYSRTSFNLLLLSLQGWCDYGLQHLSARQIFPWHRDGDASAHHFGKGYQTLIRDEYMRTIGDDDSDGLRLVRVAEYLGERCNFTAANFAGTFEYEFLVTFLDGLSGKQLLRLGDALSKHLSARKDEPLPSRASFHLYFLGFWVLEHLNAAVAESTNIAYDTLCDQLFDYYREAFMRGVKGENTGLQASAFFLTLPWHRLAINNVSRMMALTNDSANLAASVLYAQEHPLNSSSAIQQHMQVLMLIGTPERLPGTWARFGRRSLELVLNIGFGDRGLGIFLFDTYFGAEKYDLWSQFCSYINGLPDEMYDDFFDRCVPNVPLAQLFALREKTTVLVRADRLQKVIEARQFSDIADLGLIDLEKAFVAACNAGDTPLATSVLSRAQNLLAGDPFASSKNQHVTHLHKTWLTFGYKWDLMLLFEKHKADAELFEKETLQKPIPHAHGNPHSVDFRYWRDCENFRRYIIAAAYRETDPKRCVLIMESLVEETKDRNYSFLLFTSRLACLSGSQNPNGLKHALAAFLDSLRAIAVEDIPNAFVASVMNVYKELDDLTEMDAFWSKLSTDQRNRIEILRPYCETLIKHENPSAATKIIKNYRSHNHQSSEGLELDELMRLLSQATSNDMTMRDMAKMVTESLHRTTLQLARHYKEISGKQFDDYVAIVREGKTPTEFLYEITHEVARELLLRKTNLQILVKDKDGSTNLRIADEDLINDWFVSLFEKRMAEAHIALRDQKRTGKSESGLQPGQVDGYITDQWSRRIAMFEAFRLFNVDTTIILKHLNKIAGYDQECVSPVFIVAYCQVPKFERLTEGYRAYISQQDYSGFAMDAAGKTIEVLENTGNLWVGRECRWRGTVEVTFYHLLINLSP
ncbi:hypothetical protein GCM10007863_30790 [Dyella mobilis]|nr:hypothetical protein GCM10007863_30790 [Dyella mobilis]